MNNIIMKVESRGKLVYYVKPMCCVNKRYYIVCNSTGEILHTYDLKENAFICTTNEALQHCGGNIEVHYIEQEETIIYRDYAVFEDIRHKL